jgi:regulator of protease activity HflC (stomatin/prohibitin superfamily)
VDRQTDGDETFFKNFTVTLQKPEPPKAIKDALVAQQSKVADAAAKKAEADAQVATAKAQKALEEAEAAKAKIWIDTLGADGYLKKLVIESGQNPYQPASALVTDK